MTRSMDPVVQDILKEALVEFAGLGLAGARIDAIAARTRTSKRMIYYHFGSKEALYTAVLDHAYREVRGNAFDPSHIASQTPAQALDELVGHAFDSHCNHPEFVRLVMYENLQGGQTVAHMPDIARLNQTGLVTVAELLARGQAAGTMRPDLSAREVYMLFVSQCFHYVSNRSSSEALLSTGEDADTARLKRRAEIITSVRRYVQT